MADTLRDSYKSELKKSLREEEDLKSLEKVSKDDDWRVRAAWIKLLEILV